MAYQGRAAREFVDLQIVQQHIAEAKTFVATETATRFERGVDGALRHMPSLQFDSALEVLFWVWWTAIVDYLDIDLSEEFQILPQHEVRVQGELYRVDFLVSPTRPEVAGDPKWNPIAVEVDGHAFHERTREQVASRDRRDRALQQAGWRIFHFSHSEFVAEPARCVREVVQFTFKQVFELQTGRPY